jgi:uncharacterized membrane protein YpjA
VRQGGPVAFFGRFKTTPGWAVLIALINLVGIAYGFYYYLPQFRVTPVWLWPFVPDSPLAVLWAELALLAFWLRRRPGWLDALAFVGNVQVGLWTAYVLLAYAPYMGTFDTEPWPGGFQGPSLNAVLLVGHLGMAVLGLIFLQGLRDEARADRRRVAWALGIAAGYYLVNDALDYFGPDFGGAVVGHGCGMRPYTVPCLAGGPETALTAVTFGLTLVGLAALWLAVWPRRVAGADPATAAAPPTRQP